ncbi:PTS sugar transporter subunit IIC [Clostridium uliginosum]|uniref:Permease IIC component n=1 Tax=Clostridium uliginosum TaxID=119641 RepID=A0A1I1NGG3_9CLOT|nr:PTS transporter subunit EIIC [Clostridium uliginosum]SFC93843.1 PTS system, cellobiose-specific IIC component [Clostridium uliginosum]
MNKFELILEEKISPIAQKISGQRHLRAIRDSFATIMTFLIIGSVFMIIANFPINGWEELQVKLFGEGFPQLIMTPVRVTFDFMSIYIAGAIAYNLSKRYNIDAFTVALLSIASFVLLIPFDAKIEIDGVSHVVPKVLQIGAWVGAKGLIVAIIVGIVVTEIFNLFIKKDIRIKMPPSVPEAVSKAFSALIPGFVIITLMLIVRFIFAATSYGSLLEMIYSLVAMPAQAFIGNNVFGAIGLSVASTLFWFLGINATSTLNGVIRPFWMQLQEQNMTAIQAGLTPPNILTEQFYDLIYMGGIGATLAVCIFLTLRSKSKQYKEIGKISVIPGMFNINEPVMFGLPIVLNPFAFIPLLVAPVVLIIINYYVMYFGIVPKPNGIYLPWTTPPIIQGYLITGSIKGALLQLFDMFVVMGIWFPFIKLMDKKQYELELQEDDEDDDFDFTL